MSDARPFSLLPAVKCSNCGAEIEISMMGEHVCKVLEADSPVLGPGRLPTAQPDTRHLKHGRNVPSRIDPETANKLYNHCDRIQTTTIATSASDSVVSPLSADSLSAQTTWKSSSRATKIQRPPSPLLSANLDCAFPAFPMFASTPAIPEVSPVLSSRLAGRDGTPRLAEQQLYNFVAKKKPRPERALQVPRKRNSVSPKPSLAARPVTDKFLANKSVADRIHTKATSRSVRLDSQNSLPEDEAIASSRPQSPENAGMTNRAGRPVPPRPQRPDGIDSFLTQLKEDHGLSDNKRPSPPQCVESRSSTFPSAQEVRQCNAGKPQTLSRVPSELSIVHLHSEHHTTGSIGLDSQAALSTAVSTISASSADTDDGNMTSAICRSQQTLPVPSASTSTADSSPHIPARSDSSASSSLGSGWRSSISQPSPAISMASSVSSNWPIHVGSPEEELDHDNVSLVNGPEGKASYGGLCIQAEKSLPVTACARDVKRDVTACPDSSLAGSQDDHDATRLSSQQHVSEASIYAPTSDRAHDSVQTDDPHSVPETQSAAAAAATMDHQPCHEPAQDSANRRPGTSSRHHCRGCDAQIVGKSMKAADGRLTGRYHKHCFFCTTCKTPFATADFYVMNNQPYCEHHYHQLNESLCASCDRGIEGQYVETQPGQKFHQKCFACVDCHAVLSDGYFEISGKVYCERDAFVAIRGHTGLTPQRDVTKRQTRLMIM